MYFLYVYKYRKKTGRMYSRTLTVFIVLYLRDETSECFYLVLFFISFFSVFSNFIQSSMNCWRKFSNSLPAYLRFWLVSIMFLTPMSETRPFLQWRPGCGLFFSSLDIPASPCSHPAVAHAGVTDSEWKLKTLVGIKGHRFIRIIHSNTINSPCWAEGGGGGGGFYSREKKGSKPFSYLNFFLPTTLLTWQLETKEGHRVRRHFLWYTWGRVKFLILSTEWGLKRVGS